MNGNHAAARARMLLMAAIGLLQVLVVIYWLPVLSNGLSSEERLLHFQETKNNSKCSKRNKTRIRSSNDIPKNGAGLGETNSQMGATSWVDLVLNLVCYNRRAHPILPELSGTLRSGHL